MTASWFWIFSANFSTLLDFKPISYGLRVFLVASPPGNPQNPSSHYRLHSWWLGIPFSEICLFGLMAGVTEWNNQYHCKGLERILHIIDFNPHWAHWLQISEYICSSFLVMVCGRTDTPVSWLLGQILGSQCPYLMHIEISVLWFQWLLTTPKLQPCIQHMYVKMKVSESLCTYLFLEKPLIINQQHQEYLL